MRIQSIPLQLSPRQALLSLSVGLFTVLGIGIATCIALVFLALWLLTQLALLILQVVVESLTTIGTTYQQADPMVKFLILVGISYVFCCLVRHVLRSRSQCMKS